jgi:glycerol-3-phosphate dehydrogenase
MEPLSAEVRTRNVANLSQQRFDVLVIGGGLTGAGVALDAVSRGYSVALVEKGDFASGTSSKATKLVHGGIRYLSSFDFGLVHEALVERGLLLQNAPYLVHPIEFVLPMYEGDRHPVGLPFTTPRGIGLEQILTIGLTIYDLMAGKRSIKRHRHLTRDEVLKFAPALVTKGLKDGFTYYDAQTHDARLTMALILTAAQYGALVTNYTQVTSFVNDANGKLNGAVIHDNIGDREYTVKARYIINATGVYASQTEELSGVEPPVSVEPSKGVHLVFSREAVQISDRAIVFPETEDRRILFLVPWESRVVFGTTDTGGGDLEHPVTTHDEIEYMLKYLNRYLSLNLTQDDIISTYAGYRPLVKPRNTKMSTAKLSRSHIVLESASGLISIVGGKLTTYRRMAQDTIDVLSRRDQVKPVHPTQSIALQGSAGWARVRHNINDRGLKLGLTQASMQHLGRNYGTNAQKILDLVEQDPTLGHQLIDDLPYIQAEVLHAVRNEMAMTLRDVLSRRTSIIIEDRQRGLGIANEVATILARELNWTESRKQAMLDEYQQEIDLERRAASGQTDNLPPVAPTPKVLY